MTEDTPRQKTTVQLPADLHKWLRHFAVSERQSMNQVIVHLLEDARTEYNEAARHG